MRAIRKAREPGSLTQYRASEHAAFDDFPHKEVLRNALVKEQRGLCCYCLSRIPGANGMKIEHWHSQSPSKYPEEQLDYTNLLGACKGNEGQPRAKQHCDSRKADQHLSRNPANPAHAVEDFIRFEFDGSIASTDPIFDTELNAVLNLNLAFLKNNRKAMLDAFKVLLGKDGRLERHLQKWNGELDSGALQPYCQVVVYWLRKRLRP